MARNGSRGGRGGLRPAWSRAVLLLLSVLTMVGTTEVPAYAGGASSPSITASPSSATTATALTWAFTSSAAATSCELDRGTTVVSALADCTSGDPSATFDVSSEPGGSYTFTVYDAAAADVVTDTPSATSTVDVAPVAPDVSRTTSSPNTSRSPEWTFDTPTGSTLSCELDDPDGDAVDHQDPCSSPYDGDLTGLGDGTYTLSVTATAGGVSGAAGTSAYRLDTTAPAAPTATPSASPGHDLTPAFALSGVEPGATLSCTATAPDSSSVPIGNCQSAPTLHIPAGDPDGTYTLSVTQTDVAGNTSPAGTGDYVLDTVAPPAPSVTAPASPGIDHTPSFDLQDTENGVSFQCSVDGPSTVSVTSCGATATIDLNGADSGTYTLSVTASDAAHNVSDATTATYLFDANPPTAPTVTGPATGSDRSPAFAVAPGRADVTLSCAVDGPSAVTVVSCGDTTTLDLTGAADGDYDLSVTATDALGRSSVAGSATYRLDTVAPPAPDVTAPDSPDSSRAPAFTVTDSEPGVTLACTVTGPSTVTVSDCDSTTTVDLTGGDDGDYVLSVTATDAAGNTSGPTTATYTLDTVPPPAPIVVVPTSPSNDPSPTFGISDSEAGTRLTCVLIDPVGDVVAMGLCPNTGTFDTLGHPDGSYDLIVTAYDHAGNPAFTAVTWQRDTTPPPAPVVTAPTSPSPDLIAGFDITESESAATLSCSMTASNGDVVLAGSCPADGNVDTSGFVDGVFTLSVTATDEVGNTATTTVTWTRDTTAPPTPTVTAPASPSHDRTPTFTLADGEPAATLDCVLIGPDGTTVVSSATCPASGTLSTAGAGDGTYTLHVTAVDEVGNVSGTATATYLLDTVAPPTPAVTAPTSPSHDRSPTFTVSDAEPGVTYTCTVAGPTAVTVDACDTTPTLDLSAAVDGTYTLSVTAADDAGNISAAGSDSFVLDSAAPPAPTLSAPSSPAQGRSPVFTLDEAASGVTFSCTVSPSVSVSDCDSAPTLDLTGAADGTYTLSVTATDVAGNTSSATTASYTLDTTAPLAPTVVAPTSPSSDVSPTFWITEADSDATLTCVFTAPNGAVLVNGSCPADGTFATTGGGDGDYNLKVTATDIAGNDTSTTVVWTLDTTSPPAPVVVAPASPGNTLTPSFDVSDGDATASLTCVLTAPAGPTVFSGSCGSGSFSTAGFGDGVYTLAVTATDPAGNTSSTTVHWTRDTLAPPTPSITGPATPGNNQSPSFAVSDTESGVTFSCTTSPAVTITACGTTTSLNLTSVPDGDYTLSVTATDSAGNVSAATASTYTLDTTAPATPVVTAPASPKNGRSPSFTVSDSESGVTFSCSVSPVVPITSCGASSVLNLAGAPDGPYTLSVTATDAAGNSSTAGTATYTLDTAIPPTPVVTAPAQPDSNRSPSFTVTDSQPNLVYSCTVVPVVPITACGATTTLDLSAATDRTYTVSVIGTNAAGNASLPGTATDTLDTTSPAAPVVVAPTSPSTSRFPVFSVSDADPTATFTCTTAPVVPVSSCGTSSQLDLTGAADGSYTLSVKATDAAGNVSAAGSASYVLDTTAPAAPTVSPTASTGRSAAPSFTVSDSEPGVTYLCAVTPSGAVSACGTTTALDLSGQPDQTYTLTVSASDSAGNVSSATAVTYQFDTTAPPAPTVVVPASPGRTKTPMFAMSDSDVTTTLSCLFTSPGGRTVFTGTCPAGGVLSTVGFGDGAYTLVVTATDPAGNTSSTTVQWTRDTLAPTAPTVSAPTPASPGKSRAPSFAVSDAEVGVTYVCTTTPTVTVSSCGATTTLNLGGDPDGPYTVTVSAVDLAGNVSAGTSASYTLDTTAPATPVVTAPASPKNGRSPSFTVSDSESGVTFSCSVSPVVPITSCGASSVLNLAGAPDGPYTLSVTATDAAGNSSTAGTATYTLDTVLPPTPVVTGPASPGRGVSPSFTVTDSQPNLVYSCTVVPVVPITACGATTTLDLSAATDRTYTVSVIGTNAAGNASLPGTASYRLDTTPPPVPTVTAPAAIGNGRSPVFTISDTETGATFTCSVTPNVPFSGCGPTSTLNLTGVADGAYKVSVTATDPVGNVSLPSTATYTLDTTAPATPVVVAPASPAKNTHPVFSITEPGTDPSVTLSCAFTAPGGGVIAGPTCPSDGGFDTAGVDGAYVLAVTATDAAGNTATGSATYTLDTTPPPVPTVTAPAATGKTTSPRFAVSDAEPGVTYTCSVSPAGLVASCGNPIVLNLTGQADLQYSVTVTATDPAGNASLPSAPATYILDTVAPGQPTVSLDSGTPSSNPKPTWHWTPSTIATEQFPVTASCQLTDPRGGVTQVSPCPAETAITTPLTAGKGTYTMSVTVTDAAGNQSLPSTSVPYTLDPSAFFEPTVYLQTPAGGIGQTRHPIWHVTPGPNTTVSCRLFRGDQHGTPLTAAAPCTLPRTSANLSGLADGDYTLVVTAAEPDGTQAAPVPSMYILDTTPPHAPRLIDGTRSPSADTTPEWTFELPPDASMGRCVWSRGGTTLFTQAHCQSETTFSLAGLSDGPITVKVYAYDAAANRSQPLVITHLLDRNLPGRPDVTAPSGSGPTAVWTVHGDSADTFTCTLLDGGNVVASARVCGSHPTYQMGSFPSATYTLSVTQTDNLGVVSLPGTASWSWVNSSGGGHVPGGPGPGTPGGTGHPSTHKPHHPPVVSGLPGIVQHVINKLGKVISHPGPTVHHVIKTIIPAPPSVVTHAVQSAVSAVGQAGGGTGFPLILVGLVVVFLIVQNRIDRRDPKLAFVSAAADDLVEFQPPPSREDGA